MADNCLFVPMHLDAMMLDETSNASTTFLRFEMNYRNLNAFRDPQPRPFEGTSKQPDIGMYLHWTLPNALRNGIHRDNGSTEFPLVPNRWLVVRIKEGSPQNEALKAWILVSDFMSEDEESWNSPYIQPDSNPPKPVYIGKSFQVTPELTKLPEQNKMFLTAVAPGNMVFSVYSPGVNNVFSFYDDMTENDNVKAINNGSFSYYVAGWYSNPEKDPLKDTLWEVNTNPSLKGNYKNNTFDWLVYSETGDLPKRTMVHSLVSEVQWERNPRKAKLPENYPTDEKLRSNVKVAFGNTAVDALSAIIALDKKDQKIADLLEAFQYELLEKLDEPGSSEALNTAIRQQWFGVSSGGTLWDIVPENSENGSTEQPHKKPVLTKEQEAALAGLNKEQSELDRQRRILESMQWNLMSLWWKNMWRKYRGNKIPVDDDMKDWLKVQLPLQMGEGSECKDPEGVEPEKEDWYIFKVKAQQNLVRKLADKVNEIRKIVHKLLENTRLMLKALNMPGYHYPNDPVIMVTGLGRSTNLDPADGLTCRLTSQLADGLVIDDIKYDIKSIKDKLPSLRLSPGLVPDCVQQLNAEAFFLSPEIFSKAVFPKLNRSNDVRKAIKELQHPGINKRFTPVPYSMEEWKQPWIPLLLDWEVTVLKKPAYSEEKGKNICFLQHENWEFDGKDYVWKGPTEANKENFNESESKQMTLSGRTFISQYPSLNLAKQLQDYVNKHKLRSEEISNLLKELKSYIEGIQGQDILAQRLSGLMSNEVQKAYSGSISPSEAMASIIGDSRHLHPLPFPAPKFEDEDAFWDFAPLCGTFFVVNKLLVIDAFGRTVNIMHGNYSTHHNEAEGDPKDYFYPIAGRNIKYPKAKNPAPEQRKSENPTQRMMQLTPHSIKDSQLSMRLVSNDGNNSDIYHVPGANPVCCWLVPNHLDRSLAVYAPDGKAWGELYLSLHSEKKNILVWQPDPTNQEAPQTIEDIPNMYARGMLHALEGRDDYGGAFSDFIRVIDETLWTVNPRGQRNDQNLSVLIGRPLALIRSKLSLKTRGLPYYSQDWLNTFDVNPQKLPEDNKPAKIAAIDGGISRHLWPVRLGSRALRDDGLVGYFLDDPISPLNSFAVFNSVVKQREVKTNYIKQIGEDGNHLKLRLINDYVSSPDQKNGELCYITMLADPRASIHAYSGILPAASLDIPEKYVTGALANISYTFKSGPFLTLPGEVSIPKPAEDKGNWSWFDNVLKTTVPVSNSDGKVRLSNTPPLVKEGWLKFKPNQGQHKD